MCPPDCVYALGPCVCQDVSSFRNSLSRCVIFRQVTRPCIHSFVLVLVCVTVCMCVCTGSLCLSGCFIVWQQPVKMFHLSSGDPSVYTLFVLVFVCVTVCVCMHWVLVSVRMFHALATACQDVSSFVR